MTTVPKGLQTNDYLETYSRKEITGEKTKTKTKRQHSSTFNTFAFSAWRERKKSCLARTISSSKRDQGGFILVCIEPLADNLRLEKGEFTTKSFEFSIRTAPCKCCRKELFRLSLLSSTACITEMLIHPGLESHNYSRVRWRLRCSNKRLFCFFVFL